MTQYPPPQQVPPGYPGYPAAPKRPVWPMVVGIISTILGSLGLLCNCVSIPASMLGRGAQQAMQQFPEWWGAYQLIGGVFGLITKILLLIGGICLIRRRPAGLPLSVAYALLELIACVIALFIVLPVMANIDMAAPGPAGPSMKPIMMGSMLMGVLVGAVYPIFLLIWFARPSIRRDVRSWARPPGGQTAYQGYR